MNLRESPDRGVRFGLGSKGDRNRLVITPPQLQLQVPLKAEACSMIMRMREEMGEFLTSISLE